VRPSNSSRGGSGCRHGAPAQHGLHAGHELARLEGLGHVVVGAQLQPDHAVHHLAAGGEHDQGDVAVAPDGAAQLEAVHLGQHDVEDGGVEPALSQPGQSRAGAQGLLQRQIEALEVGRQRGAELGVVVDQQDAGHGAILSFMHVGLAPCTRCGDQPRWYQRPRLSMNSRTFCCWAGFRLS
jgi:hypothetical protein